MHKLRQDLRATEESIRLDAEAVSDLEDEKASLEPTDPRLEHLSIQVERLAKGLKDKAGAELALVEEIQATG